MIRLNNQVWRFLWPARVVLTPTYLVGLRLHKSLYHWGIKRRYRPPVSVICVGNLSTGGTGKTPLVIAICRMLQAAGRKVAVLTRGYKKVGPVGNLPASPSPAATRLSARDIGDEPFLMTEKLSGVEILVSPNRAASARIAVEELGCDALVMDDGFQHWALERDLDIVLIDASQPARFNHLMPWGNLREGFGALRRAHVAVIAKARNAIERDREVSRVRRASPDIAVWHVDFAPRELKPLSRTGSPLPLSALVGQPVILVCGIAAPDGFERTADSLGCRIVGRFFYRDHFSYPDLVIRYLEQQAEKLGARFLLATEKDAVKLRGRTAPNAPWHALAIEPVWLDPPADRAAAFLNQKIAGQPDRTKK